MQDHPATRAGQHPSDCHLGRVIGAGSRTPCAARHGVDRTGVDDGRAVAPQQTGVALFGIEAEDQSRLADDVDQLAGSCESNTDAPTGLLRTKDSTAA
jgi:hypothetical protein